MQTILIACLAIPSASISPGSKLGHYEILILLTLGFAAAFADRLCLSELLQNYCGSAASGIASKMR
ncbi:MAG: hypothetical protein C5B55_02650 [Blastocatellia bacterium]|nr:MAG: hypothetical protein C5B55_02650 [Blastocatellia bacterium]